jgi:predicted amino acid dehydrogenase
LDDACAALHAGNAARLSEFLVSEPANPPLPSPPQRRVHFPVVAFDAPRFERQQQRANGEIPRVAWLCHMIDAEDLRLQDPSLRRFSSEQCEELLHRLTCFSSPVVMSSVEVASAHGERVQLYPVMLPFTSRMARGWLEQRQWIWPRCLIQGALDVARELGCAIAALGQYTSILTRNGRMLESGSMGLSSGNSYTVALTLSAIERALRERGLCLEDSTLAILGGAGNIGRICAQVLAPRFARTLLIGGHRRRSRLRTAQLAATLPRALAATHSQCGQADVVLCAVNAAEPTLRAEMLAAAKVVCDVSVPGAVGSHLAATLPHVRFVTGGLARLPGGEDLEIASFPLPPGRTFGCMAEALLLGLSGVNDRSFTGAVTRQKVADIEQLAHRHGFELAEAKEFCVFGGGGHRYQPTLPH